MMHWLGVELADDALRASCISPVTGAFRDLQVSAWHPQREGLAARLAAVRKTANTQWGLPLDGMFLVEPPGVDAPDRRGMLAAAREAGFSAALAALAPIVLAALAQSPAGSCVLTYALSARRFECAVVRILGAARFEVLSHAVDEELGADCIDMRVAGAVLQSELAEVGLSFNGGSPESQALLQMVPKRIALARSAFARGAEEFDLAFPFLRSPDGRRISVRARITASSLGQVMAPYLRAAGEKVHGVLSQAGVSRDSIASVVLSGEMTGLSIVRRAAVASLTRSAAGTADATESRVLDCDPKWAAARGAALVGAARGARRQGIGGYAA